MHEIHLHGEKTTNSEARAKEEEVTRIFFPDHNDDR